MKQPVEPFDHPFNDPRLGSYSVVLLLTAHMQGDSELNSFTCFDLLLLNLIARSNGRRLPRGAGGLYG